MNLIVFRQDRKEDRRKILYQEILRGRLRQGWGYNPAFSLSQDKQSWMRAYHRDPVSGDPPKSTYEKIAGMLKIQPGDLLVVPNQPDDQHFLLCKSVASEVEGESPCYEFIPAVSRDFRHCISINPASVHQYRYAEADPEIRESLTNKYYRSPVQFIRNPQLISRFLRLCDRRRHQNIQALAGRNSVVRYTRKLSLVPFAPKSDSDCTAHICGGFQTKTRHHESLVRKAGNFLRRRTVTVHTPHPIDLYVSRPQKVIFEAKVVKGSAASQVREAVGQLFWYRYKYGPTDALLCVLLDRKPSQSIIDFVEKGLGLMISWMSGRQLHGGPKTESTLKILS